MKLEIKILTTILLMSFSLIAQDNNQIKIKEISVLMDEIIQKEKIPAISVGVIIGDATYFINKGVQNKSTKKIVHKNSIYQIASLGKTFIGIIAHQAILDGKLQAKESIVKYLPMEVSNKVKSKLQGISILDLLQHRSGLPAYQKKKMNRKGILGINNSYTEEDFISDLKKMKIKNVPGKVFSYSNFGYALLSYILEKAYEKPYDELLSSLISSQYKMFNTTMRISTEQEKLLVQAYNKDDRDIAVPPYWMGKLSPATTVYSTVSDLLDLMKNQLESYSKFYSTKELNSLVLTQNIKDAWNGTGISYGYGLFDWGNGRLGHGGDMDGYASEYLFIPSLNSGFVVLTSSGGKWIQEFGGKVGDILEDQKIKKKGNKEEIICIDWTNKKNKNHDNYKELRQLNGEQITELYYKNLKAEEDFETNGLVYSEGTTPKINVDRNELVFIVKTKNQIIHKRLFIYKNIK